jgi:hypothetical protein
MWATTVVAPSLDQVELDTDVIDLNKFHNVQVGKAPPSVARNMAPKARSTMPNMMPWLLPEIFTRAGEPGGSDDDHGPPADVFDLLLEFMPRTQIFLERANMAKKDFPLPAAFCKYKNDPEKLGY